MSKRESEVLARLRRGMQSAARGRAPYLEEDEDGQMRVVPDISVRPDAARVRPAPFPDDYRDSRLPANYARPPEGWEFPGGGTRGIPGPGLRLNVGPSANVEDRRTVPRYRGVGPHPTGAHIDVHPDGTEEYMFPPEADAPAAPRRAPPHPLAESVRSHVLRERAARGNRRRP